MVQKGWVGSQYFLAVPKYMAYKRLHVISGTQEKL